MTDSTDLTFEAFAILRDHFFDRNGLPKPFPLREKRNTQDNPLDEYICDVLRDHLQDSECVPSPGPLISPDLVLLRPDRCNNASRAALRADLTRIVGIEVKKLERTESGSVARSSGLDYNTTPPCGVIRVYDANDYLSAIGQREKEIGLGTYENGVNRNRPMFIFANPLGAPEMDHSATLIHSHPTLAESAIGLKTVYRLIRTVNDEERVFYCYRLAMDVETGHVVTDLTNPFSTPSSRSIRTQSRGRFRLPIEPLQT